jgi:PLP dependent protein
MEGIAQRLEEVKGLLPKHVTLVAVSKTHPVERLMEAYDAGQRDFGENRVQELLAKQPLMPADVRWHLIGHLQRNKVKQVIPFVHLIHAIDSDRLLFEVDKQAAAIGRVADVLLQFHIAQEDTKFGFDISEAQALLRSEEFRQLENVRICGVMGMATFTEDERQVRAEFAQLRAIFLQLQEGVFSGDEHFSIISMGMSGDYNVAIEEGSTLVRVGSAIFGSR